MLQKLQKDVAASSGVSSANGQWSPSSGGSVADICVFFFCLLIFSSKWDSFWFFERGVVALWGSRADSVRGDCLVICCAGVELGFLGSVFLSLVDGVVVSGRDVVFPSAVS